MSKGLCKDRMTIYFALEKEIIFKKVRDSPEAMMTEGVVLREYPEVKMIINYTVGKI